MDYSSYRNGELVSAPYRDDVTSPQANNLGAPATYTDFNVDLNDEADWDLAGSAETDQPLDHTVYVAKFTYLGEACCRADATFLSSLIDVVGFGVWRVLASATGAVSFDVALHRIAKVSDVLMGYNQPFAQLNSITSECGTWRLLAPDRDEDIISLRSSLDIAKE